MILGEIEGKVLDSDIWLRLTEHSALKEARIVLLTYRSPLTLANTAEEIVNIPRPLRRPRFRVLSRVTAGALLAETRPFGLLRRSALAV